MNILNRQKVRLSQLQKDNIKELFDYRVDNFPWVGWLKDRKGYFSTQRQGTKLFGKENVWTQVYKLELPHEKFYLLVYTYLFNTSNYNKPYKIIVRKL